MIFRHRIKKSGGPKNEKKAKMYIMLQIKAKQAGIVYKAVLGYFCSMSNINKSVCKSF